MTTNASPNQQQLVLLGAGRAHVQTLKNLARRGTGDVSVTLVTPYPHYVESEMLAGYVAGQYPSTDLCVPLSSLVEMSGADFAGAHVRSLDPVARQVRLSNGDTLSYDVLSIDLEPNADRQAFETHMPGARTHAMFMHPRATFMQLWPRLCELAMERALHVAVIGDGLAAAEMAMTAAPVLAVPHGSRVTWIAGGAQGTPPPLAGEPSALARRVLARLKRLHVTVLQDQCVGLDGQSAQLASGASLQCDAPIITGGTGYPAWLLQSGLQLTDDGAPKVNERLQSESHRQIFIAPLDADAQYSPVLNANLWAALTGGEFKTTPKIHRSRIAVSGQGQAIMLWGPFSLEGRFAWRMLNRGNHKRLAALLAQ
ncbi:MAG: FAD-dependent oxidoreductase [Burkholderiaceae bacterium]|jgi:NADH dehydrogenase FAD-containing subunit|nr:FAD-dependent oxidoreductase [Burkholderiaceae bacterium]